jgi:hypothetical protein
MGVKYFCHACAAGVSLRSQSMHKCMGLPGVTFDETPSQSMTP